MIFDFLVLRFNEAVWAQQSKHVRKLRGMRVPKVNKMGTHNRNNTAADVVQGYVSRL